MGLRPLTFQGGLLFFKILFLYFREGVGREKEKYQCERETLIGSLPYTPQPGTEHSTQARALVGNQTSDLLLCRMTPNQLSHTSQGSWGLLQPRYFSRFSTAAHGCGAIPFHISALPTSLNVASSVDTSL